MRRILSIPAALLISLMVLGCSENPPTSVSPDLRIAHTAPVGKSPLALLNVSGGFGADALVSGDPCATDDAACKKTPPSSDANVFSGPLFGLATAPNGDILIADVGAGVVELGALGALPLPGITDIAPLGRGSMWATTGAGEEGTSDHGQGLHRVSNGESRKIANLFQFEEANDPDGTGTVDSNPFDVASLGGNAALVADAAANVLLRVSNQGRVDVLAVFPQEVVSTANLQDLADCDGTPIPDFEGLCDVPAIPAQAVPTSVAIGPDGNYYVGELKGFPAPTGASNIWRVSPGASWADCGSSPDCVKVFDGGFTSIIDLAFDADGNLLVAELDEKSWLAVEFGAGLGGTVNSCDLGSLSCTEVATGIPMLTAVTLAADGRIFATMNALIPPLASVVPIP